MNSNTREQLPSNHQLQARKMQEAANGHEISQGQPSNNLHLNSLLSRNQQTKCQSHAIVNQSQVGFSAANDQSQQASPPDKVKASSVFNQKISPKQQSPFRLNGDEIEFHGSNPQKQSPFSLQKVKRDQLQEFRGDHILGNSRGGSKTLNFVQAPLPSHDQHNLDQLGKLNQPSSPQKEQIMQSKQPIQSSTKFEKQAKKKRNPQSQLDSDKEDNTNVMGRWSRAEHETFVEAMHLFGKNWIKVEAYIGTRTGAQIRSHAQKFINRLQKDLKVDPDKYINQKGQQLLAAKQKLKLSQVPEQMPLILEDGPTTVMKNQAAASLIPEEVNGKPAQELIQKNNLSTPIIKDIHKDIYNQKQQVPEIITLNHALSINRPTTLSTVPKKSLDLSNYTKKQMRLARSKNRYAFSPVTKGQKREERIDSNQDYNDNNDEVEGRGQEKLLNLIVNQISNQATPLQKISSPNHPDKSSPLPFDEFEKDTLKTIQVIKQATNQAPYSETQHYNMNEFFETVSLVEKMVKQCYNELLNCFPEAIMQPLLIESFISRLKFLYQSIMQAYVKVNTIQNSKLCSPNELALDIETCQRVIKIICHIQTNVQLMTQISQFAKLQKDYSGLSQNININIAGSAGTATTNQAQRDEARQQKIMNDMNRIAGTSLIRPQPRKISEDQISTEGACLGAKRPPAQLNNGFSNFKQPFLSQLGLLSSSKELNDFSSEGLIQEKNYIKPLGLQESQQVAPMTPSFNHFLIQQQQRASFNIGSTSNGTTYDQ